MEEFIEVGIGNCFGVEKLGLRVGDFIADLVFLYVVNHVHLLPF